MNEHKPECPTCKRPVSEENKFCSTEHYPDEPKAWRERFDDEFVGNKDLDYLRPTRPDHLRGFIAQVEVETAQRARAEAIRECVVVVDNVALPNGEYWRAAAIKALTDKLKEL